MKLTLAIYNIETLKKCAKEIDCAVLMMPHYSQIYENDFDVDKAISFCIQNNIDFIISISKIFMENELDGITKIIKKYPYKFLISDLGVLQVFLDLNRISDVIYDSSTMICNSLDSYHYNKLNMDAFSLSNEIPINDLIKIYKTTNANIYYQVFGRKLMFYSKRKLVSCYEKHNNLSLPKTSLFIREEKREDFMPVFENENGFSVCRPYYINLFKEMKNLSFIKYAYIESLTLNDDQLLTILKVYKNFINNEISYESGIKEIIKLNLIINDGFSYSDTIHQKEKIINE